MTTTFKSPARKKQESVPRLRYPDGRLVMRGDAYGRNGKPNVIILAVTESGAMVMARGRARDIHDGSMMGDGEASWISRGTWVETNLGKGADGPRALFSRGQA